MKKKVVNVLCSRPPQNVKLGTSTSFSVVVVLSRRTIASVFAVPFDVAVVVALIVGLIDYNVTGAEKSAGNLVRETQMARRHCFSLTEFR